MPRAFATFLIALALSTQAIGQAPPAAPAKQVAATVNGRPITEAAVERGLKAVAPENRAKARPEVINYLVEHALVDQYLELLKVAVEPKDVDAQIESFKKQLSEAKQEFAQVLQKMVAEHAAALPEAGAPPASAAGAGAASQPEDFEDQRLQKIFNEAFADEAKLVRETFESDRSTEASEEDEVTINELFGDLTGV